MVPPGAGRQDTRVDATAGKPQLAQPGHATQEYRLHQPTFLDAERTRLLAANLGTGSPRDVSASGVRLPAISAGHVRYPDNISIEQRQSR